MISVPDKSFTLAGPMYAARHPSTRTHLASFCAGERDNGKALYQQNNSLKNEVRASGPKAGNSAAVKLEGFYGCLLVVIGSGEDWSKKKGQISSPTLWALASVNQCTGVSASDSLGSFSLRSLRNVSNANCTGRKSGAECEGFGFLAILQFSGSDLMEVRRCSSSRATVMICWISSPALTPISSTRVSASREDSSKASSFPSVCLRAISPCIAETINPAEDSPSCFNDSMLDTTSCGTLTVKSCDFVFLFAEDIGITPSVLCVSVYSKMKYKKALTCVSHKSKVKYMLSTGRTQQEHSWITETAKPRGALTPSGLLTTTVSVDNEVAMSNRITPPAGRASLSPNLFLWRFLALNRHDKKAMPCRLSVEAATEREARRILAPHFILSLAARLPVREVRHA